MPDAVIDIHAHAFPDAAAKTVIGALEKSNNIKAYLDGTLDALLASMDDAGIEKAVVCSIATRPEQFQPILDWSLSIRSSKIIPFPSIHPAASNRKKQLRTISENGFKGIKLHPFQQDFYLDDPHILDLLHLAAEMDLVVLMFTGDAISAPNIKRADPDRILTIYREIPELKMISTHLGGLYEWDRTRKLLTGLPIYMEISFAFDFLDQIRLRDMILSHPKEYILFGSASPWANQKTTLKLLEKLGLPEDYHSAIIRGNATRLLGL